MHNYIITFTPSRSALTWSYSNRNRVIPIAISKLIVLHGKQRVE